MGGTGGGRGENRRRRRYRRGRPAYRLAIVSDLEVLVQVQDGAALGVAQRRRPEGGDGAAEGDEEEGETGEEW
jgi:hypothetical protein